MTQSLRKSGRSQAAKNLGWDSAASSPARCSWPLEGRLQASNELAAKHAPQYSNGKEEAGMRSNPAGVIAGESAGGDDTVDMRMKLEFLIPAVQHAEEADIGAEMGGVASHFE